MSKFTKNTYFRHDLLEAQTQRDSSVPNRVLQRIRKIPSRKVKKNLILKPLQKWVMISRSKRQIELKLKFKSNDRVEFFAFKYYWTYTLRKY